MDDADEINENKKKGVFIRHRYRYTGLSDEETDLDDDRYNNLLGLSAQACQSVRQAYGHWAYHAASIDVDEPQLEMYQSGLSYNKTAVYDVNQFSNALEQYAKALKQHDNSVKEEFEKDRESIPFTKRVVNSILDDIPATIFWVIVSAFCGYLLGFLS